MLQELQYNNKILSQEERVKFNDLADEMIATFSESIDGMYKISREYTDMNNIYHKIQIYQLVIDNVELSIYSITIQYVFQVFL